MGSYVQLGTRAEAGTNDSQFDAFASLCVRHDGDLLCVYRGNVNAHTVTDGGDIELKIYNGSTWGSASTIRTAASGHDLREPNMIRLATADYLLHSWNDVLATGHSSSNVVYTSRSTDDGATWGTPVVVDYSGQGDGYGITTNRPIQLASGRILLGIRVSDSGQTYDSSHVYYSDTNGATWAYLSTCGDGDGVGRMMAEPSFSLLSNGDILCLLRDGVAEETWYCVSTDNGATWSTPVKAFDSSGAPKCELYDGRVYVFGRSDNAQEDKVWIFWCDETDTSKWYGPWEFRETAGTEIISHVDGIAYGGDLVAVWSEGQSATDSDLYWGRIATSVSEGSVLAADSFNRANSSDIGKCDGGATGVSASGAVWIEAGTGEAVIASNKISNTDTVATHNSDVYFDFGEADVDLTCKLVSTNSFNALRFRHSIDYASGWQVQIRGADGNFRLYRRDAGTATLIDSYAAGITGGTEYTVRVVCSGSKIECYLNGNLRLSTTSSTYASQTVHGWNIDNVSGNAATVDDFSLVVPAAPTGYTLTAAVGSFTLTGQAAGLQAARKLAATAGSFATAGQAAGLTAARKLPTAAGTFALTGNATRLAAGRKLAAVSGSFSLTGNAATLKAARRLSTTTAAYNLTGNAAGLTGPGSGAGGDVFNSRVFDSSVFGSAI